MRKIIVIGGGVAGLTAALMLAKKNYSVTLLEARNRLGGRIYTEKAEDEEIPIELGASYWEGFDTNPFFQRYFSSKGGNQAKPFVRRSQHPSMIFDVDAYFLKQLNAETQTYLYQQAKRLLQASLKNSIGKTHREMIDACDLSSFDPQERAWLKKIMEYQSIHQSTPLENVGLPKFSIPVDAEGLNGWNDDEANNSFVGNGYNKIISQLQADCEAHKVSIVLEEPVVKILDEAQNGVVVNSMNKKWRADKVVCALPLGVLKRHLQTLFGKPLSKEKQKAIHSMGVHESTRVVLRFSGSFWEESAPYILLCSSKRQGMREFRNNMILHGKPILQTPSYAMEAKCLNDEALIHYIMQDLQKAFGNKAIFPLYTRIYRWSEDPYALGAYPYRTLIMDEKMHEALEREEGNIYFVGADFSRYGFSVHHAFASGKQIAAKL